MGDSTRDSLIQGSRQSAEHFAEFLTGTVEELARLIPVFEKDHPEENGSCDKGEPEKLAGDSHRNNKRN